MLKADVKFYGDIVSLTLAVGKYTNGRTAISASADNDGPFGTLTVNIPDAQLAEDEIIVKTYSENAAWVPQVLEQLKEHFTPTGREVHSGFISAPVYKFKQAVGA